MFLTGGKTEARMGKTLHLAVSFSVSSLVSLPESFPTSVSVASSPPLCWVKVECFSVTLSLNVVSVTVTLLRLFGMEFDTGSVVGTISGPIGVREGKVVGGGISQMQKVVGALLVGERVGRGEGEVGALVGSLEGKLEGDMVGLLEGDVGDMVGGFVGEDGATVGDELGTGEGTEEGAEVA